MTTNENIETAAKLFRRAFDQLTKNQYPSYWGGSFPAGTSGDVSLILGAHFKDIGIDGFQYICGERGDQSEGNWTTHAWLMRADLIVDVTADQFVDAPSPVIVAERSPWHGQFEFEGYRPDSPGYRDYDPPQWELPRTHAFLKDVLREMVRE